VNFHKRLGLISVQRDLARLETRLAESVTFGDEYLDTVTARLIHAGGERLRPLLAIASATGGERPASPDDLSGAVALELMHLASLYHDDVMDGADVHCDVDNVNARDGNLIAIVAGDYLMARSAAIAADLGAPAAGLLAHTLASRTRGQICEVRTAYSLERTESDYLNVIEAKSAAQMASSCRMGALTARRDERESRALSEFGRCFGMVYQLRDDIVDVLATDNELSKPAGQDLAEGIYNLPTLFALRDAHLGDELRALLGAPLNDDERERARKLVIATDAVAQTVAAAQKFLGLAHRALQDVKSEALQRGFASLIEVLLEDLPSY